MVSEEAKASLKGLASPDHSEVKPGNVRSVVIILRSFSLWILTMTPLVIISQGFDTCKKSSVFEKKYDNAEILSGGFLDFVHSGQVHSSARIFRLYIGEPGKFQVPLSLFTGISTNHITNNSGNRDAAHLLLNPSTGIINLSFDAKNMLLGKKNRHTRFYLQYQTAFRFLNVFNNLSGKNKTFFNMINGTGLTFITGAWQNNRSENVGIFWINIRGLHAQSPKYLMDSLFSQPINNNMLGYSGGFGIEIDQTLNIKIFYFRFVNNQHMDEFTNPFFQLSFNYSIN